MKPKISFVGVGRMGANMARRLQDCGYPIATVLDLNRAAASALAEELGSHATESLAEVTARADIVITVVTNDDAMRAIFQPGAGDSLLIAAQGKLFLNCATVTPAVHLEIAGWAQAVGASALEVCMASSITQARDGTLYLMCAGEADAFARAEPLLRDLGKEALYVGPTGTAAQLKALVNMVMNINTAGLAEGLGLAAALGLDLALVQRVFRETGAASRMLETDGLDMVHREHEPFFSAAHAAKDSGIALRLAEPFGLVLPLATATKQQYDTLVRLGLGELDKSAVAELTFPGRALGEVADGDTA